MKFDKREISYILTLVFLSIPSIVYTQEICDNGIDDDGDGLIDLQDVDDCECKILEYDIIRGDFEQTSCCPTTMSSGWPADGIGCLDDGWESVTGTPDFMHMCGYLGIPGVAHVPLPIPQGFGAVGFISNYEITFFETIGLCLDAPFIAGEFYTLSFWIGFNASDDWSSDLDVAVNLYGINGCDNIPLDWNYGCPADHPKVEILHTQPVQGLFDSTWLYVQTIFNADFAADGIAFGLSCTGGDKPNYHYLDGIQITGNFIKDNVGNDITVSGDCVDGVALDIPPSGGATYQWFVDGVAIPGATESTYFITDPSTANYTVVLDYGWTCKISPEITVEIDFDAIEVSGNVIDLLCETIDAGEIDIYNDSPHFPHTFNWSNSSTDEDLYNLAAGEYTVTVTDEFGCYGSSTFTVNDPPYVEIQFTGDCNDGFYVSVINPIPGATYEWFFDGDLISTGTENSYLIENIEDNGFYSMFMANDVACNHANPIIVYMDPQGLLVFGDVVDNDCFGGEEGSIDLDLVNVLTDHDILWSTGDTIEDLDNLSAGIYQVTVSNDFGCYGIEEFEILEPPIQIEVETQTTLAGCAGEATGSINLTISGTALPHSILWDSGETTEDLNNLTQGQYVYTITDDNGCVKIDSVFINANSDINIESSVTYVNCSNEGNGSIELVISGGTPPIDILWNTGATTPNIYSLEEGFYQVTLLDSEGCSFVQSFDVFTNSDFNISSSIIDNNCFGDELGSIDLTIENASSNYTILWSNLETTENIANLVAGQYSYQIQDSFGCNYLDTFLIEEGNELIYQSIVSVPGCNGNTDGSILISPCSGELPVTYLWSTNETTNQIANLNAGTFTLTITDNNGCISLDTFLISESTDVIVSGEVTQVLCNGDSTGSINLQVSGGNPPYIFDWDNDSNTEDLMNVPAGDYAVVITDSQGCSKMETFTINEPPPLSVSSIIDDPKCFDGTGTISVETEGGVLPYMYSWSTNESGPMIVIEPGNTYVLTVTDDNGCMLVEEYIISDISEISIQIISIIQPTSANNDGMISIDVSGGTEPLIINWDNGDSGTVISDLSSGTYTVTATDANGCVKMMTYVLTNEPLTFSGALTNNICFGDCFGEIQITVEGGVTPYIIVWSDGQEGATASNLCNGEYFATITDGSGETIISDIYIVQSPSEIIIDGQAYDISCVEIEDGAVAISAEGGSQPFNYMWSNSMQGDSIGNLATGEYIVTVIDENGCTESNVYSIDDIPLIDVAFNVDPLECEKVSTILSITSQNTQGYSYLLNQEEIMPTGVETILDVSPGVYSLSYLISDNCIIEVDTFVIEELPIVEGAVSPSEIIKEKGEVVIFNLDINENEDAPSNIIWTISNYYECIEFDANGFCISMAVVANNEETVEIVIIDDKGCEQFLTADILLEELPPEIHIPNVFSPNNDGTNDWFNIVINREDLLINSFIIFDRWGNKVFSQESKMLSNLTPWDGRFKNHDLQSGVYVFMLDAVFEDGTKMIKQGDITLVR